SGCSAVPRYPETNAELHLVLEALKTITAENEFEKAVSSVKKLK
ncbi:MAG: tRNA 4-thiouridine(8) synthase ThiI, partial [Methanobacterium sp.]|nr:tRNA 4-thiouridine(8) synthase ThiI [Methanobacterium sp.]